MAFEKGSAVKASHDYFRATYGERTWERVLETLTADERALTRDVEKVTWYPVETDGKVFRALVDVQFGGDRTRAGREFWIGGRKQADTMLEGLFSVFARFVSPEAAFKRSGSILSSIYQGVTAGSTLADGGNAGTLVIEGLGQLTYISPWIGGWIERALERFGATEAHVVERTWEAGQNASDELIFELRWS